MAVTKRSVSLDDDVAEQVERAAEAAGWHRARRRGGVRGLTYDTGALIAAERDDRLMWALHRATLGRGITPTVPAGVLAEAWRGGPQPRLSSLLKGCHVEPARYRAPGRSRRATAEHLRRVVVRPRAVAHRSRWS